MNNDVCIGMRLYLKKWLLVNEAILESKFMAAFEFLALSRSLKPRNQITKLKNRSE